MFAATHSRSTRWAAVLLAVVVAATQAAGQEERYRERQVLDPETGEWMDEAPQPEAAPVDELDEARSLLAQGEARKARKLLKDWVKNNPDHERYLEGMFLLGEAYFELGDYYAAYERYEIVVGEAVRDLFYKALRREMDAAQAFLSGEKRIVWKILRLPAYDDGVEILDRVWERVPGTRMGEEALRLKADHFFNRGEMDLAQDEYVNLTREYPAGRFIQLAMLRSAEAAEAAFPGIRFEDRALVEAEERYRQVVAAFPPYAERERVPERLEGIRQLRAEKDLDVAKWYDHTGRAGAAEFYYRVILKDWPDSLAASEARNRLRAMGIELEREESQP
jgi:outer membrane protein assembly factor BamD (BamD/ComL family)